MIPLTWRQFRIQGLVAGIALAVVGVIALVTRPHLVELHDALVATCAAPGRDCASATQTFLRTDANMRQWLGALVTVVPGLIGVFWGAPLVATEIEGGTFRVAWTQSVTRARWLGVKLGLIAVASAVVTGLFSLALTWWASPLDAAALDRFGTFDQRAIVPVGFAVFGFVLGVTLGVAVRRTLPAMTLTLVVFVAARLAVVQVVRPRLMSPLHHSTELDPNSMGFGRMSLTGADSLMPEPPHLPNAWIYSTKIVDRAGDALDAAYVSRACPALGAPPGAAGAAPGSGSPVRSQVPQDVQDALHNCVTKLSSSFHQLTTYQPSGRYWTFQWYETSIYLAMAAVLAGLCFWLVQRRPS